MIKTLKKLVKYFIALTVILLMLYFSTGFVTKNHRLGTVKLKHDYLESINEPKSVLIGGSNLHYGLNSELLSKQLSMPVVNMGTQGSIGLRYMFNEILPEIGKGDIVVLCAEPAHYSKVDCDGEIALYSLLSKYPVGFKHLNSVQVLNLAKYIGPVIDINLRYLIDLSFNKLKGRRTVLEDTNVYGDYVGHKGLKSIFRFTAEVDSEVEFSEEALQLVEQMKQKIEQKNATLLISAAPTASSTISSNEVASIDELLSKTFGAITISKLKNYTFPDDYFFDTQHHLMFDRRDERTMLLGKEMKDYLTK